MGAALAIRTDLARPAHLRMLARRERSPRTTTRMLAIAGALEGKSRRRCATRHLLKNASAEQLARDLLC